jgi:hypothetical protein
MVRMFGGAARRLALEVLGWTLVLAGIAALVLPGPGLLMLFAGLVVLSQQYEWAERRVEPVKRHALKAASDGVQTWPRIVGSLGGVAWLVALGVFWLSDPPAPGWWPAPDSWWLLGGTPAALTLIGSGLFALGLIVYSYRKYRGTPYDPDRGEAVDVGTAA